MLNLGIQISTAFGCRRLGPALPTDNQTPNLRAQAGVGDHARQIRGGVARLWEVGVNVRILDRKWQARAESELAIKYIDAPEQPARPCPFKLPWENAAGPLPNLLAM